MSDVQPISVVVNGEAVTSTATTLAMLVEEQGYGTAKVATAVNGMFVPLRARAETEIAAHDRIEIVSARQGG